MTHSPGSTARFSFCAALPSATTLDRALGLVEAHLVDHGDFGFFAPPPNGATSQFTRVANEFPNLAGNCFVTSLKESTAGPAWTAAVLARILARARDDPQVLRDRKLCLVVNSLCSTHQLASGFDAYGRWFPEEDSVPGDRSAAPHLPQRCALDADAQRRLRAVHSVGALKRDAQGTGAVLFPTTREENGEVPGCLFEVRLRMLPLAIQADRCLLLSPESTYYLHDNEGSALNGCAELERSLEPTLRQVLDLKGTKPLPRFLLNLALPEGLDQRPTLLGGPPSIDVRIEGRSLGFAVVLAAWAAANRRYLRRLCVTAVVDEGKVLRDKTTGVQAKLGAFRLYRDGVELPPALRPRLFLAPEDALIGGDLCAADVVAIPAVPLREFVEKNAGRLFTDGFDDYRAWLAQKQPAALPEPYAGEDQRYYEAAATSCVATLRDGNTSHSGASTPHDAEPADAARFVLEAAARELGRYPDEVAALPVALPLFLHEDSGSSLADRILAAIERLWPSSTAGSPGPKGTIDPEILADVLGRDAKKLLLAAWSRMASECAFGDLPNFPAQPGSETEAAALKRLVEAAPGASCFLVASNDSHLRFLEKAAKILRVPFSAGADGAE